MAFKSRFVVAVDLADVARSVKEAAKPLVKAEEGTAEGSWEPQPQELKERVEQRTWATQMTAVGLAAANGFGASYYFVVVGEACHQQRRNEYFISTVDRFLTVEDRDQRLMRLDWGQWRGNSSHWSRHWHCFVFNVPRHFNYCVSIYLCYVKENRNCFLVWVFRLFLYASLDLTLA